MSTLEVARIGATRDADTDTTARAGVSMVHKIRPASRPFFASASLYLEYDIRKIGI